VERSWELTYQARPWLLNSERAGGSRGIGGHYGRAEKVSEWREAYAGLCLEQRIPPLEWITVEAVQTCRDKRMPDIGGCFPAVKAAIDGIVDAGVIPDDDSQYLHALTFLAPQCTGTDALHLRVSGPECRPPERAARERALRQRLLRQVR
jgi:hypothetical protein